MNMRLAIYAFAFVAVIVLLGTPGTAAAQFCGWCVNDLEWLNEHKFTGVSNDADLSCEGDGDGCHSYWLAGLCDDRHFPCGVDNELAIALLAVEDDPRLSTLDAVSLERLRSSIREPHSTLVANTERSALQLLDCTRTTIVAHLPVAADQLASLTSND